MTPTVSELRDQIRVATGRYERLESTAFTKEALAAICDSLDTDVDTDDRPSKDRMRAAIRSAIGLTDDGTADGSRPFRKSELEAIASAVEEPSRSVALSLA